MGNKHKKVTQPGQSTTDNNVELRKRLVEEQKFLNSLRIESYSLPSVPRSPNSLRFVVISDTHSKADEMAPLPDGDVLIHAGDFSNDGAAEEIQAFLDFLAKQPHKYKILVGGNHDVSLDEEQLNKVGQYIDGNTSNSKELKERARELKNSTVCNYLDHKQVEIDGIKLYGIPWIFSKNKEDMEKSYATIPKDTDILLTHAPPYGYGDIMIDAVHSGQVSLLKVVAQIKPKFHLFGHAHEGYGCYTDGNTIFINAAICTRYLQATNLPIVFDFEK